MKDMTELKKLVKDLQSATSNQATIDILNVLKKDVVATEALLRESKAGLAVGKLRSSTVKEIADIAKELVKKWKAEVDRAKAKTSTPPSTSNGSNGPNGTSTAPSKITSQTSSSSSSVNGRAPVRRDSVASTIGSPPVTPVTASSPNVFKGQIRTANLDGISINFTDNSVRDKTIEMIYNALASDSGAPNDLILGRAKSIESIVLSDSGNAIDKNYRDKMRSLFLNLKDKNNPGLRESIVSGELAPAKLCKMSSQEMASEERKAADKKIQEENLHKSLGAEEQQAETDAFQCGRCKQRKTRYRQAQTRSADEPMTTFVTCVVCNNRWKFS